MVTNMLSVLLNEISGVLLLPCMIILCLLALAAVLTCGAVLGEFFLDRRFRPVDGTALLLALHQGGGKSLRTIVEESGLIGRQKRCLHTLLDAGLPPREREVLAGKLLADEEGDRRGTLDRTNLIVRLGPMAGLLGTLIPLGPGIVALGQGDTVTLSQSLEVAFNTTIVGVAASGAAYAASVIRRRWYRRDSVLMESLVACCLEEMNHE